eukprot:4710726-Pleurochrysis_carterae.AAC.2
MAQHRASTISPYLVSCFVTPSTEESPSSAPRHQYMIRVPEFRRITKTFQIPTPGKKGANSNGMCSTHS